MLLIATDGSPEAEIMRIDLSLCMCIHLMFDCGDSGEEVSRLKLIIDALLDERLVRMKTIAMRKTNFTPTVLEKVINYVNNKLLSKVSSSEASN